MELARFDVSSQTALHHGLPERGRETTCTQKELLSCRLDHVNYELIWRRKRGESLEEEKVPGTRRSRTATRCDRTAAAEGGDDRRIVTFGNR